MRHANEIIFKISGCLWVLDVIGAWSIFISLSVCLFTVADKARGLIYQMRLATLVLVATSGMQQSIDANAKLLPSN